MAARGPDRGAGSPDAHLAQIRGSGEILAAQSHRGDRDRRLLGECRIMAEDPRPLGQGRTAAAGVGLGGGEHQLAGNIVSANQLDQHIYVGVVRHLEDIGCRVNAGNIAVGMNTAVGNLLNHNRAACAAANIIRVAR